MHRAYKQHLVHHQLQESSDVTLLPARVRIGICSPDLADLLLCQRSPTGQKTFYQLVRAEQTGFKHSTRLNRRRHAFHFYQVNWRLTGPDNVGQVQQTDKKSKGHVSCEPVLPVRLPGLSCLLKSFH